MSVIGYHLVKTTYGTWLPGDARGHWSSIQDDDGRYIEHRKLHGGDEERRAHAQQQMKAPPTYLSAEMMTVIEEVLVECAASSEWKIAAGAIEPTHLHLLITDCGRRMENTVTWLSHRLTMAIRKQTGFLGPLWTHGHWCETIADGSHWQNLIVYIENHNVRRGVGPRPYKFLC